MFFWKKFQIIPSIPFPHNFFFKVTKTLFIIILAFNVCWLPYAVRSHVTISFGIFPVTGLLFDSYTFFISASSHRCGISSFHRLIFYWQYTRATHIVLDYKDLNFLDIFDGIVFWGVICVFSRADIT